MPQKLILIHLKDDAVKGVYRPLFERDLITKLSKELKGLGHKSITRKYQRIFIEIDSNSKVKEIKEKLLSIKEINYFCFPKKLTNKIEEIKQHSLVLLKSSKASSFKPKIKLVYKAYPIKAKELTKEIGNYLIKQSKKTLDFIDPETTIYIEIMENASYAYDTVYKQ